MNIERRLRDRNADTASARRVWKLIGLALLASAAVYWLLTHARAN